MFTESPEVQASESRDSEHVHRRPKGGSRRVQPRLSDGGEELLSWFIETRPNSCASGERWAIRNLFADQNGAAPSLKSITPEMVATSLEKRAGRAGQARIRWTYHAFFQFLKDRALINGENPVAAKHRGRALIDGENPVAAKHRGRARKFPLLAENDEALMEAWINKRHPTSGHSYRGTVRMVMQKASASGVHELRKLSAPVLASCLRDLPTYTDHVKAAGVCRSLFEVMRERHLVETNPVDLMRRNAVEQSSLQQPMGHAHRYPELSVSDEELLRGYFFNRPKPTINRYRTWMRMLMAYARAHGANGILDVTTEIVVGALYELKERGAKPSTEMSAIGTFSSVFVWLHDQGKIGKIPTRGIKRMKVRDSLHERILTIEEVRAMIAAARSPRDRLLIRVLYLTGLRAAEICGLRWSDVTIDPKGSGATLHVFGKGRKTRLVAISIALVNELKAARELDNDQTEPLFPSREGTASISRVSVYRIVRDSAKAAGIKKNASPHWLRHAHASHCLDGGAPVHQVQKALGHSSLITTDRYIHARGNLVMEEFLNLDGARESESRVNHEHRSESERSGVLSTTELVTRAFRETR